MKKYKIIIYVLIAAVIVGALIYFVFIPQIKNITLLWANNSIKKDELDSLNQKKSQISNLKAQAKDAEDLTDYLAALLPSQKDTGRFLIDIQALANNTGTDLTDVKFSEEKTATQPSASNEETSTNKSVKAASTSSAKFKTVVFEISDVGSYSNLMSFLTGLEKINRAILIEKADLSQATTALQANFKGKIYYK